MQTFTLQKIYKAYFDCRKMKRNTINALKFEIDLENNIKLLYDEIVSGQYCPGRSICFVVAEPKPREIFAADFRDRVVHHLLVNELIGQAEKSFIHDSYACRKGKGTHKAVSRLAKFASINSRDKGKSWFMKLDIKSFFMSIDKNILYTLILDLIDKLKKPDSWKNDLSDLAGIVVFHEPTGNYRRKGDLALARLVPPYKSLFGQPADKGIPIGNYSSQFFANLYLNRLDHFIKRELKCRRYIRYVDDLLLMAENPGLLKNFREKIGAFLSRRLNLELNYKKAIIQPLRRGINFLGYFLKNGRVYPGRKALKRYKAKLYPAALGLKKLPWPRARAIAASCAGHAGYF